MGTASVSVDDGDRSALSSLWTQLGVELVDVLSTKTSRQTYLVSRVEERLIVKTYPVTKHGADPYPVSVHRDVIPALHQQTDESIVRLPRLLDHGTYGEGSHWIVLDFLDGQDLRGHWSYSRPSSAGGRLLDPAAIDHAVEVLAMLATVEIPPLVDAGLKASSFANHTLERRRRRLRNRGRIPAAVESDWDQLVASASAPEATPLTGISNGDFRPSNLILGDDVGTAVVDWDGAKTSANEIEESIAYFWIFLYARPDLQARFLRRCAAAIEIDRDRLTSMVIVLLIRQADTCRDKPSLVQRFSQEALTVHEFGLHLDHPRDAREA